MVKYDIVDDIVGDSIFILFGIWRYGIDVDPFRYLMISILFTPHSWPWPDAYVLFIDDTGVLFIPVLTVTILFSISWYDTVMMMFVRIVPLMMPVFYIYWYSVFCVIIDWKCIDRVAFIWYNATFYIWHLPVWYPICHWLIHCRPCSVFYTLRYDTIHSDCSTCIAVRYRYFALLTFDTTRWWWYRYWRRYFIRRYIHSRLLLLTFVTVVDDARSDVLFTSTFDTVFYRCSLMRVILTLSLFVILFCCWYLIEYTLFFHLTSIYSNSTCSHFWRTFIDDAMSTIFDVHFISHTWLFIIILPVRVVVWYIQWFVLFHHIPVIVWCYLFCVTIHICYYSDTFLRTRPGDILFWYSVVISIRVMFTFCCVIRPHWRVIHSFDDDGIYSTVIYDDYHYFGDGLMSTFSLTCFPMMLPVCCSVVLWFTVAVVRVTSFALIHFLTFLRYVDALWCILFPLFWPICGYCVGNSWPLLLTYYRLTTFYIYSVTTWPVLPDVTLWKALTDHIIYSYRYVFCRDDDVFVTPGGIIYLAWLFCD